MSSHSIIETLVDDYGVFEFDAEDELTTSAAFDEQIRRVETIDENAALTDRLMTVVDETPHREALMVLAEEDPVFVRRYLAVREFSAAIEPNEAIQATVIVGQLENGHPPTAGVPSGVLPVRGDQLETLLTLYRRAVVYVWLDNCEPCEEVKSDFELAFEEPPTQVALFAVYGPNWAKLLDDRFDVPGGPATLFIRNGQVDVRLYGAYGPNLIQRETEKLYELDTSEGEAV